MCNATVRKDDHRLRNTRAAMNGFATLLLISMRRATQRSSAVRAKDICSQLCISPRKIAFFKLHFCFEDHGDAVRYGYGTAAIV